MALYTFYTTIMAVIHLVKYRKMGSPVLSAAKAINLATAMVSMLALETAMLTEFDTNGPEFRRIVTGTTGAAVCIFVVAMAAFMMISSTKKLKKLQPGSSQA